MNREPLRDVTDADVGAFARDGVVPLRGVLDRDCVETIDRGIEKDLAHPGPYGRIQSDPDDPGFFFTDYYMWKRIPEFHAFATQGPGGAIAARLLGSGTVNYFYDGLFVKEPGTRKPTVWHQDQVYYNVDGAKVMVLWIPVTPVAAENALRFVRGSHRWDRRFTPILVKNDRVLPGAEAAFEPLPDIDGDAEAYDVVAWDLEPGDCVAFHGLTLHGAGGNSARDRARRAISTTWLGDDAVFGERPGEVEPRIEGRAFRPGERLDDPAVFPPVWPPPNSNAATASASTPQQVTP